MVAALLALLAFAPFASAAADPLSSGTTTLTLNKGLFKKLKKSGVTVAKVSPGAVKGRTVTLPVSGGALDPTSGAGTVEHSGGFKFKAGKKSAAINTLVLETTTSSLNAKVAGKSMKFASVTGVTIARNGFGANVSIGSLKLTGKAAKQLNKKLGFTGQKKGKAKNKRASISKKKQQRAVKPPFKGNQVLGASISETQPKTVTVVPGGKATLAASPETLGKFAELKVEVAPTPPAEVASLAPPAFAFPIAGGTIAPNATSGIVQTVGGFKFTQEPVPTVLTLTMTLNSIWVDLGAKTATVEVDIESSNPALAKTPGNLGRSSIADLNLTGATISSDPATHTVSVTNASATLQAVTAEVLNEVFAPEEPAMSKKHKEVFKAGDPLGTFSFTAQTQ